jgi:hypothetical protein
MGVAPNAVVELGQGDGGESGHAVQERQGEDCRRVLLDGVDAVKTESTLDGRPEAISLACEAEASRGKEEVPRLQTISRTTLATADELETDLSNRLSFKSSSLSVFDCGCVSRSTRWRSLSTMSRLMTFHTRLPSCTSSSEGKMMSRSVSDCAASSGRVKRSAHHFFMCAASDCLMASSADAISNQRRSCRGA